VISPVDKSSNRISLLIEEEVRFCMSRAFHRYEKFLDVRCEIGAGSIRDVQRWLRAVLPSAIEMATRYEMLPENRKQLRTYYGQPTGIHQLIFGKTEQK
jgi:hypothetical protein